VEEGGPPVDIFALGTRNLVGCWSDVGLVNVRSVCVQLNDRISPGNLEELVLIYSESKCFRITFYCPIAWLGCASYTARVWRAVDEPRVMTPLLCVHPRARNVD
jgi:hypothetical protein